MKPLSAIIYASSGAVFGALVEVWHMHTDHDYAPELGIGGSLIGLLLFALLYALVMYCCALALHFMHRDRERISAFVLCAVAGAPFWFIILYIHRIATQKFLLPDKIWLPEAVLVCALSFEGIRLADRYYHRLTKRPDPPLPGHGDSL